MATMTKKAELLASSCVAAKRPRTNIPTNHSENAP